MDKFFHINETEELTKATISIELMLGLRRPVADQGWHILLISILVTGILLISILVTLFVLVYWKYFLRSTLATGRNGQRVQPSSSCTVGAAAWEERQLQDNQRTGRSSPFFAVHNVYIVQYVFLPTEQSETYFKIFIGPR